ncbi:MAG TPA: nitrous oxide reductase accessory protein NosL [Cyclobacteriaceae bacterium]|nr:nitrous oxide reductase accessory protein NosL [Cyclobacteriaceae bacterium]
MMRLIMISLLLSFLVACSSDPQPLQYGKDICHTCKMTLMDKKFGSEIVTKKGKVYKFDDLNCMVNFYNSGYEGTDNIEHRLVIDFANPEKFIDAEHAFFVKTDEIRTPMASGIAAFGSEEDYSKFNKKWKGTSLSWGDLVTAFK